MDVAGFGESSIDHVYVVDGLPHSGVSKLRIVSHYSVSGGQVATTMAACAALGLRAAYLGVIGTDENGHRVERELRDRGVDTTRALRRTAPNRYAVILVDRSSGERTVFWERDARLDVPPAEINLALVAEARVVHVDATDELAAIALARAAREAGAVVTCDIDEVTSRTAELLALVNIPVLAEQVPRMLTGVDGIQAALRELRRSHDGVLYVTLGAAGSAALEGSRFVHETGRPVNAVDTTGAGDVFRAGVIYGIVRQWPTEMTLRFANAAAAVSCTRSGAMSSVPLLADVEQHLR
jgi:sulfofructose kinase